jgi:hypothetical protein
MTLFLTLLDRFKNHIFYERKRMKKLALFCRTLKKLIFKFLFQDWGIYFDGRYLEEVRKVLIFRARVKLIRSLGYETFTLASSLLI